MYWLVNISNYNIFLKNTSSPFKYGINGPVLASCTTRMTATVESMSGFSFPMTALFTATPVKYLNGTFTVNSSHVGVHSIKYKVAITSNPDMYLQQIFTLQIYP